MTAEKKRREKEQILCEANWNLIRQTVLQSLEQRGDILLKPENTHYMRSIASRI